MTCHLCGAPLDLAPVHGAYGACRTCGLVQRPGALFVDDGASGVADGWPQRASHLGPDVPKSAHRCPGVNCLADMLERGPVYVETPSASAPQLSLAHHFRERLPVYYSPETLAVAIAMAGAADVMMDEVAGCVVALVIPGDQPRTYAQAVAELGIAIPGGDAVAERLRHYFDPKPPEVMGGPVPGECFLCGGVRRAWRSVTICETCSATTTHAHGPLLDELAVKMSSGEPVQFIAPDMRTSSPADVEMVTTQSTVMLDEAGWAHALVMAGADVVRTQRHSGALDLQGATLGAPRRKTFAEASDVVVKLPLREARHTLAIWNTPIEQASPYEMWIAGEDCDDVDYLRAEAKRDRLIASAAVEALEALMHTTEAPLDDPDDWHPEPYMNGFRMGSAAAWQRAQAMLTAAWMACVERTVRDE